ncbi:hypothetical protein GCM10009679_47030 [Saccharothrix algeriensis]|uniref:Uncharacterized protein n=1 Tax=Catellatospora bangladeshensis TaxID=310355 RepID=A0A8J3NN99_9ACTN|nr:hypothetical protein Cba03nite_59990 [Catellatospora bangladeshensis]
MVFHEMFSFAELLLACMVGAVIGACALGGLMSSWLREVRQTRRLASRQRRQAQELLRLAEQAPGVNTDAWDAQLLRRVAAPARTAKARVPMNSTSRHRAA